MTRKVAGSTPAECTNHAEVAQLSEQAGGNTGEVGGVNPSLGTKYDKLYVIVRAGLGGVKTAQAVHAFRAFVAEYPAIEQHWYETSNNIVVLDEADLDGLADRLDGHGLAVSRFHEPDLDGQLTAICVEPRARHEVRRLKLTQ